MIVAFKLKNFDQNTFIKELGCNDACRNYSFCYFGSTLVDLPTVRWKPLIIFVYTSARPWKLDIVSHSLGEGWI